MAEEALPSTPPQEARVQDRASPRHPVRDILNNRNFRLLWFNNGFFFAAQQMQLVAMQWLVLDLTGTRAILGLIATIQALSVLLFSPFGGVISDRSPKRNVIIAGQAGLVLITAVLGTLVVTNTAQVWHIALAAVAAGFFLALTQPATQAFLFDVVGRDRLMNAIALNATATSLFSMAGPALGGTLIATIGIAGAYFAGGSAYFLGIVLISLIPILGMTSAAVSGKANFFRDIAEGLKYVKSSPITMWLLGITGMNFFGAFVLLLRPVYAREVLDVGASGLGIMGLTFGAGSLVSSILVNTVAANVQRKGYMLIFATFMWDVGMIIFALSRSFPITLIGEFTMGCVGPFWMSSLQTMLQTSAPDHMRSRVMAVYFMMMQFNFFGQFLAGVLADAINDTFPLLMAASIRMSFLAVALFVATPLRNFGRPAPATG